MNFVLKIVEGPNRGAEIALVEGVAVTLGKGDECDIVLADATLPDAPLTLKAAADGVTLDGEPLEPFSVVERGATVLAVGPANAPWGELKWPEKKMSGGEATSQPPTEAPSQQPDNPTTQQPDHTDKRRFGCLGWLVVLLLLLLALIALGWFFRAQVKPYAERAKPYVEKVITRFSSKAGSSGPSSQSGESRVSGDSGDSGDRDFSGSQLKDMIVRYDLVSTNRSGRTTLVGDFATRGERLAATAEAYASHPGIELDFADVESLKAAAEDTLALIEEKGLRVAAVTNRVVVLSGTVSNLRRTLEALAGDLPKMRDVDIAGISLAAMNEDVAEAGNSALDMRSGVVASAPRALRPAPKKEAPSLPVCGILTTPYPCLVLKSGSRVIEGAPLGDWTIARIEADSVTLTNAERSVTWNP